MLMNILILKLGAAASVKIICVLTEISRVELRGAVMMLVSGQCSGGAVQW